MYLARSGGQTRPGIAHLLYLERMTTISEGTPEWSETVAGLVTLRLVDHWSEASSPGLAIALHQEIEAVQREVMKMEPGTMREALFYIARTVQMATNREGSLVLGAVFAYAHLLQYDERPDFALDAYDTIVNNSSLSDDVEIIPEVHLRRGYCLRVLGRMGEAIEAYNAAQMFATAAGNSRATFLSRVGQAIVAKQTGKFSAAQTLLAGVLTDVDRLGDALVPVVRDEVLANVKMVYGNVAREQGESERAAVWYKEALDIFPRNRWRDSLLNDIANNFTELGIRPAAWDAHLINFISASLQSTRWYAAVNMIELAVLDGNEAVFNEYRRLLADVELPKVLVPYYHLYVGEGYHRFDHPDLAPSFLQKAATLGKENDLKEVQKRAKEALDRVKKRESAPPPPKAMEASPVVAPAVHAIRELRERTLATASS